MDNHRSNYDPKLSHRYIGQDDLEIDEALVAELSEKLSSAHEVLETTASAGWKHIAATLEHEIYLAERQILSQVVQEPRDVALVRGQILGFRTMLDIPKAAQQDAERLRMELEQETQQDT